MEGRYGSGSARATIRELLQKDGVLTKVLYAGDDMTERRKSYLAMRQLIAARELKELRSGREQKLC
jgi:hypothetical protein